VRAPAAPGVRDPWLWALLALGLGLRAGLLARYPQLRGMGDELVHYLMATFTSWFGPGVLGQWAPLYDGLLAGLFRLTGPDPLAARALQVVLSTATIAGVYALAAAAGSRRAARIAAALCAFDPSLIAFSHYLFSETLFLALLVAAACALFVGRTPRSRPRLVAAGLLFGLATLTRSVGLYFLPLWALVEALRGRRREAADALAVLALTLLVVLPWTLRNYQKYDAFLLVDATLGRTAYFAFGERFFSWDLGYAGTGPVRPLRDECATGPAPGAPALPPARDLRARLHPTLFGLTDEAGAELPVWRTRRFAIGDLAAGQRCELAAALAFSGEHPGRIAAHAARRFYAFWGPNSFLLRSVYFGSYPDGPLARDTYPLWKAGVVALHCAVVCGALLLLGRRRLPALAAWGALFVAYYTAIHMLAVAYSRYRLPLMPLLFVGCALWLADPRRPEGSGRRLAVGAGLAGLLALSAHYALVRLP
jgi:4-amino-4-deoxy-L-arabinose transferase-like glycosyltransferase